MKKIISLVLTMTLLHSTGAPVFAGPHMSVFDIGDYPQSYSSLSGGGVSSFLSGRFNYKASRLYNQSTGKQVATETMKAGETKSQEWGGYFYSSCKPRTSKDSLVFEGVLDIANDACGLSAQVEDKDASYCKCIDKKLKSGIEETKRYTAKEIEDIKMEESLKVHASVQAKLFSDAIFQFISSSEQVGYSLLGNVEARKKVDSSGSGGLLCIPGNLQNMLDEAMKDKDGNDCFNGKNSELVKRHVAKFYADTKGKFSYFKLSDAESLNHVTKGRKESKYKSMKGSDALKTLVADSEASLMHDYKEGLRSLKVMGSQLHVSGRDYTDTSGQIYSNITVGRYENISLMLRLGSIQGDSIDPVAAAQKFDMVDSFVRGLAANQTLRGYVDDEKFEMANTQVTSALMGYADLFMKNKVKVTPGPVNVSKSFLRLPAKDISYSDTGSQKVVAAVQIARKLLDTYRKRLGKKPGYELTHEDVERAMVSKEASIVEKENKKCKRAFKKLKRSCSTGSKGVFYEALSSGAMTHDLVNSYQDSENFSYEEYLKRHHALGSLYCLANKKKRSNREHAKASGKQEEIIDLGNFKQNDELITKIVSVDSNVSEETGEFNASIDDRFSSIEDNESFASATATPSGGDIVESDFDSAKSSSESSFDFNESSGMEAFTSSNGAKDFTSFIPSKKVQENIVDELKEQAQQAIVTASPESSDEISKLYDQQIAELQKQLSAVTSKLDQAEEDKNTQQIDELNEAIKSATSTISKLKKDKEVLVQQIATGPTATRNKTSVRTTTTGFVPSQDARVPVGKQGFSSASSKGQQASFGGSKSFKGSQGISARGGVDKYGYTNDDYLMKLRETSVSTSGEGMLKLSSLSDPGISNKVRTAYKEGNRVLYANVGGEVYRIIPQLDDNGNILEKDGEVVFITEVVGATLVKDKKLAKLRAPASLGMEEKGQASDEIRFGYDTMMDLTNEVLEQK